MKDNTQELLNMLKEAANSDSFVYSEAIVLAQPIELKCPYCGGKNRINQATLFSLPNSQEKAGWVAVCPACGSRHLIHLEPVQTGAKVVVKPKNDPSVKAAPPSGKPIPPTPPVRTKKKKSKLSKWIIAILIFYFVIWPIFGNVLVTYWHNIDLYKPIENIVNQNNTEPESEPESEKVSYYKVFWEDVNWDEAEARCEAMEHNGVSGHLATITSQEEFDKVTKVLDKFISKQKDKNAKKLNYIWLGGWIKNSDAENYVNNYQWVTGEEWVYDNWCHTLFEDSNGEKIQIDEPSFYDGDILENRLTLWQLKKDELGWTFSDQDGNILDSYPKSSGKIAYICEFDHSEDPK